jgi:hypothetical protein
MANYVPCTCIKVHKYQAAGRLYPESRARPDESCEACYGTGNSNNPMKLPWTINCYYPKGSSYPPRFSVLNSQWEVVLADLSKEVANFIVKKVSKV